VVCWIIGVSAEMPTPTSLVDFEGFFRVQQHTVGLGFCLAASLEVFGVNLDVRPGAKMARDDSLGLDELDSFESIVGAHREVVADGENGDIDVVVCQPFHVVGQGGITGKVDGFTVVEFEEKTSWISTVGAVGQTGTMMSDGHFAAAKGELVSATDVKRMQVLQALLTQPAYDLEVTDDLSASTFGDCHRIAYMIAVTMRDENKICRDLVGADFGKGIVGKEGVDQDFCAVTVDGNGGMTVIGDAD